MIFSSKIYPTFDGKYMDFQTVLYIIIGIIALIIKAGNSSDKKKARRREPAKRPEGRSWQDELRELLQEQDQPETQTVSGPQQAQKPWETVIDKKEEPLDTLPRIPEWQRYMNEKAREMEEHDRDEMYSLENDPTSLPDHIRDVIGEIKTGEERASHGAQLVHGEPFDARKAFIYSEIFSRRY